MTEIAQVKLSMSPWEGFSLSGFVVRRRVTLMLLAVISIVILMVVRRYRPTHDVLDFRDPWTIAGVISIALGLLIRSWSAAILQKGAVLATEGPYSACRHPLYLGSMLMVLGFCALVGDIWAAGILLGVLMATYPATVVKEESMIAATFPGQWPAYASATSSRLIPCRIPRGWGPATWYQWRKNREYRAVLAVMIALTALAAWRHLTA